jgi:hypothetical protein
MMRSGRGARVLVGTIEEATMKAAVAVAAATAIVLWVAAGALAQGPSSSPGHVQAQAPAQRPGPPPAGPGPGGMGGGMPGGGLPGSGMMHGGMMGGMPMMGMMGGGMMCPMMGMMGGMPMMGGAQDPKTLGRMLQLHGEMMRAVGDVLLKHGRALEGSGG